MRRNIFICLLLAGITLFAFWPVGRLGFIVLDDPDYISANPNVQGGITAESLAWAFTTTHTANWHPVTWLSHMLDCELFGLNASGHHWINLGFHIANTLLLFMVLRKMLGLRRDDPPSPTVTQTGNPAMATPTPQLGLRTDNFAVAAPSQAAAAWGSALVAALFAVHPLRIESIAWASERKDVLSAFFFLLTLWAYLRYAQNQQTLNAQRGTLNYILALVFFALGLMSKPMLVTLPVILVLLDFWPLGRVTGGGRRVTDEKDSATRPPTFLASMRPARRRINQLLLEKLPFLALSLASGIVTIWAQGRGGAISDLNHVPLDARFENVTAAYAAYLGKILWPAHLSIFYPYVELETQGIIGSGLLIALFVICIWRVRSQPYLLMGWCWFVVMLLPVIGILQVGRQSIADRYTYLPSIGLSLMVACGMAGLASLSKLLRAGMTFVAAGLLLACLLDTRYQLRFWRDSITLFRHSIEVTPENNCVGYWVLGNAFLDSGNLDAAVESYQSAIQISPDFEEPHYQLGYVLLQQKQYADAEVQYREALRLKPDNADAHIGLGHALINQRKYAEAAAEYSSAQALRPKDAAIGQVLAIATLKAESENALTNLYEVLKTQPTPEVHIQIAAILTLQERFEAAVEQYLAALQLKPDSADILNNLAWLLTTCSDLRVRNGAQAVKYAERACDLTHSQQAMLVGTLAAAYAEAGRFEEAVATAQKACALASASGQPELLKRNQELLELYRNHRPYREVDRANPPVQPITNHIPDSIPR